MNNNELEFFENRRQKEKTILLILTGYGIGMTAVSFILSWPQYIPLVICLGLFLAWMICISKYKDFRFRANVLAVISLLDFTMYAVRGGSLFVILTPLAAVAILLGITALPEVLRWVNLDTVFLCFYHIFVLKTVPFETPLDKCRAVLILVSIALVEGVSYLLMNSQLTMLRQMQGIIDDLKAAENSRSDFLANVSHEIRTPINAVCGISEIMLNDDMPPNMRENVQDIQMAGRNLQRLISDLLDFTELQSGEITLAEEAYNVTSTVNDVMNMTMAQIENKQIELVVDCDAGIPRSLVGDEQKLRRVMINLLNNAVKYTQDGCVCLSVKYRKESYGVNLIVTVKDSGIGIKEENLEKIFTNFNQVDTKKNRQEGGIGLGLAISRALVLKMGGFIKISSEWEKGTEVQFVVPQKVLDEHPIIEVVDARENRVISYVNMEKYEYSLTRESYRAMIGHMEKQMQLKNLLCRNLGEMKRRLEKENFTHVFVGWEEYEEDPAFFENLSRNMKVTLIVDRKTWNQNERKLEHSRLLRIFKPFYALSIATVLNGDVVQMEESHPSGRLRFVAPEASVLVVDDSLMNLKVVEGLLRPYQIRVFTAESGAEALEKLNSCDFDFVFMDHMMPEMDGVETLHKLRSRPGNYFQNVPVIALTANAVGGAREMFLQEGFQDFVSKPIELPVLERILRKYVPEYKKEKEVPGTGTSDRLAPGCEQGEEIPCVNPTLGIQYMGGNKEDYIDIVKVYWSSGRSKIQDIEGYFEQKDWKNYSILVHAVKSTSLGIGAEKLSEKAGKLEAAGGEGDGDYILKHHFDMIQSYRQTLKELEEKVLHHETASQEEQAAGAEIDGEKLKKLLQELAGALSSFESDSVKKALNQISIYSYQKQNLRKFAKSIEEKADAFDFVAAEDELKKFIDMYQLQEMR